MIAAAVRRRSGQGRRQRLCGGRSCCIGHGLMCGGGRCSGAHVAADSTCGKQACDQSKRKDYDYDFLHDHSSCIDLQS